MIAPNALPISLVAASLFSYSFGAPLTGRRGSYEAEIAPDAPIIERRGSDFLAEATAIQETADYLICNLGLQASLAAAALGIPGKQTVCKVPTSLANKKAAASPAASTPAATPIAESISTPVAAPVVIAAALPSSFAITRLPIAAVATPVAALPVAIAAVTPVAIAAPAAITPVVAVPAVAVPAVAQSTQIAAVAPVAVSSAKALNACSSPDPEVCAQQALALSAHNSARALHHAPPLTWNDTLATAALKWANNCEWMHSGGSLFPSDFVYGENLYAATIPTPPTSMIEVVAAYTDEEALYDYDNPQYSDATGHFTQVVWKATEQVGCAIITCDLGVFREYTTTSSFSVCEYYPSGNYVGEFAANVQKP